MLDSLDIKNYRNLEGLRIGSLAKINLITGKNNTGKSAILEAIAIYASKGDINLIYEILGERGEIYSQSESDKNATESNIYALSSLFTNRKISFDPNDALSIGSFENTLFGNQKSFANSVSLRFVKYFDELQKDRLGNTISRRRIASEYETDDQLANYKIGIERIAGNNSFTLPLDEYRPFRFGFKGLGANENFQFIRTRNIDREINGKLWDSITLTDKEQYVIDALKIIEPATERIAFIGENQRERRAVIKLTKTVGVLPLRSMGDGINRILTIILALVNSDNGYLLIDEFENGLHYSIQENLWNIIFSLTQKLNIQVFVTTHSEDSIRCFEKTLNKVQNPLDGKLIRLDNDNGSIKQVVFNASELKIANDNDIEIR
jgi:AAA15 family ATPase/GTPase